MGGTPQGPYGLPPSGQPAALQEGEYVSPAARPSLFGMEERDLRGIPRVIQVPQPAAGADWAYVHSGPSWLLLRNVVAQLTTSATVATRVVRMVLTVKSVIAAVLPASATQAASLTVTYNASTAGIPSADTTTALVGLPKDLILADGMTLGASTILIQAGDKWNGVALLAEEFTDACLY